MKKHAVAALALAPVLSMSGIGRAAEEQTLSLTIYNSDLALVQDVRELDLKAGRQRLEFKDVSAAIRPETVALSAKGVSIVEQNFDYDLLTPSKMMEKAIGQQVRIVRTNPGNGQETTETATVLSVNNGVVLKIGDRIEVLRDDGAPTRVIFDKVPENLRARPTLSVTVDAAAAGPRQTTLSYLTTGLSWKADYVALFDEKAGKLGMQGWITLNNTSGPSFENAETQLIAGDINLVHGGQSDADEGGDFRSQRRYGVMPQAGTETGQRPQLADYYVYPLPERTTVANNQTKQVGFLTADGVAARKVYQYRAGWFQTLQDPVHAVVAVDFANSSGGGLGAALPAGVVRVYVRDVNGEPKFVGEDQIEHAPQGSELTVKTGEAFDVTIQPTLVAEDKVSKTRSRYSMSYLVRNARAQPVTVEIRQSGLWRDGKVLNESLKSRRVDAYTLSWDVPTPANGETTLTFEVETGW
jgi:hypothetical protein